MDRKMLDYIPPALHEVGDFVCLLTGMEQEFSSLWKEEERQGQERFLDSMQELGVARWEQMLRLESGDGVSQSIRRQIVMARLRQVPPYCFRTFLRLLEGLFGTEEGFSVTLDGFVLTIRLSFPLWGFGESVQDMIRYVVPANIETRLILSMVTHGRLGERTHGALAKYTHRQLQKQ